MLEDMLMHCTRIYFIVDRILMLDVISDSAYPSPWWDVLYMVVKFLFPLIDSRHLSAKRGGGIVE